MGNVFSLEKAKIEDIHIFIQAIEAGYTKTTKSTIESKINYLKWKASTDYINNLIQRLELIKEKCSD